MCFKLHITLLFFLIGSFQLSAQETKEDIEKKALSYFQNEQFIEATPLYLRLLSLEPRNPNYNYRYGTCLLFNSNEKQDAFKYLNYSVQKSDEVENEAFYYLAKAYHLTYQFDKAIENFKIYKQKAGNRAIAKLDVDRQIEMCRNGKSLMANVSEIIVLKKTKIDKKSFFRIYDLKDIGGELIVTEEFQNRQDKRNNHVPLIHFPSNSNRIYYSSYGDNGDNKDIYVRTRLPDGTWSKEQPVFGNVNTKYNEDYPYMHPTGKYLYFSSEGHNSMGGYDVFRSRYDAETNSFGPPENMDISISSPSNDFLYIVDSLDRYAYFASQRESESDQVHVYNVRVERFPIQMVILKGQFNSTINTAEKSLSITVNNNSGERMGEFKTTSKGDYLINLPKGGKYEFIVSVGDKEQQHRQIIDLPYLKEFRPLKQSITETEKDQTEVIIFKNLFDERFENEGAIIAEAIALKSKMEINTDQFDLDSLDQIREQRKVFDKIGLSAYSNMEIHDLIKGKYEDLQLRQSNTADLIQKSQATLMNGNKEIENALEKANSLMDLAKNSDNSQRAERYAQLAQRELQKAEQIKAEMEYAEVILSFLEDDFKKNEILLNEAKQLNTSISEMELNDDKSLISLLSKHQSFVSSVLLEDTKVNAHFEYLSKIEEKLKKQEELKKRQNKLLSDQKVLQAKVDELNESYESASKRKKEDISLEISRAENQLSDLNNELNYIDKQLKESEELAGQKDVFAQITKQNVSDKKYNNAEITQKSKELNSKQNSLREDNKNFAESNNIDLSNEAIANVSEDELADLTNGNSSPLSSEEAFALADPQYNDEIKLLEDEVEKGTKSKQALLDRKNQSLTLIGEEKEKINKEVVDGSKDIAQKIEALTKIENQLNNEISSLEQEIEEDNRLALETEENQDDSNDVSSLTTESVLAQVDPEYLSEIQELDKLIRSGEKTKDDLLNRKKKLLRYIVTTKNQTNIEKENNPNSKVLDKKIELLTELESRLNNEITSIEQEIEEENRLAQGTEGIQDDSNNGFSRTSESVLAQVDLEYLSEIQELEALVRSGEKTKDDLLNRKKKGLTDIVTTKNQTNIEKENNPNSKVLDKKIELLTELENQLNNEITSLEQEIEEENRLAQGTEGIQDDSNNGFSPTPESVLAQVDPEYLSEIQELEKLIRSGEKTKEDLIARKYKALISIGNLITEVEKQKENNPNAKELDKKLEVLIVLENQIKSEIKGLEDELIAENAFDKNEGLVEREEILENAHKGFNEQINSLLANFHSGQNNYEELIYAQEVHLSKINEALSVTDDLTTNERKVLTEEKEKTSGFIAELNAAKENEKENINTSYNQVIKETLLSQAETDLLNIEPDSKVEADQQIQVLDKLIKQINTKIRASNNDIEIRSLNQVKKEIEEKRRKVSFDFRDVTQVSIESEAVDMEKIQEDLSVELSEEQTTEFQALYEKKNALLEAEKEDPTLINNRSHQKKVLKSETAILNKESEIIEQSITKQNSTLSEGLEEISNTDNPSQSILLAQQNKIEVEQLIQKSEKEKDPQAKRDLLKAAQEKQNEAIKKVQDEQKNKEIERVVKEVIGANNFENINTENTLETEEDLKKEQVKIGTQLLRIKDQINEINALTPSAKKKEKTKLEQQKSNLSQIQQGLENKFKQNESKLVQISQQKIEDANKGIAENAIENNLTYIEEVEIAQSEEYKELLKNNNKLNQLQFELKVKEEQLIEEQNELKQITATTSAETEFSVGEKDAVAQQLKQIDKTTGEIKTLRQEIYIQQQDIQSKLAKENQRKDKIENMIARDVAPIKEAPTLPTLTTGLVLTELTKNNYSDENPIPLEIESPKGLVFRVQIGAFSKPVPNNTFTEFSPITGDVVRPGLIRYVAGFFNNRNDATEARNKIRTMGYSDAFVVAYCDGERIPVYRAVELMNSGACVPTIESSESAILTASEAAQSGGTSFKKELDEFAYNKAPGAAEADVSESKMGLYYTVQVGVYNKPVSAAQLFNISPLITKRLKNGQIRYSSGIFNSVIEAKPKQLEAINKGVSDAFITAYYQGERISVGQAQKLLEEKGEGILELKNPTVSKRNVIVNKPSTPVIKEVERKYLEHQSTQVILVSKVNYDSYPTQVINRYNENGDLFYYDSITQNIKSFVYSESAKTPSFNDEFETVSLYNYTYTIKDEEAVKRSEALINAEKGSIILTVRITTQDLNSDLVETILNAPFNKHMTTTASNITVKFYTLDTPTNDRIVNQLQVILAKLGATNISKNKQVIESK